MAIIIPYLYDSNDAWNPIIAMHSIRFAYDFLSYVNYSPKSKKSTNKLAHYSTYVSYNVCVSVRLNELTFVVVKFILTAGKASFPR